jgi:hypothetical protein
MHSLQSVSIAHGPMLLFFFSDWVFFDFPQFFVLFVQRECSLPHPCSLARDRSSRYWVACSLEEAETMRGIIHNTTGWLVKGSNCAVGMRPRLAAYHSVCIRNALPRSCLETNVL